MVLLVGIAMGASVALAAIIPVGEAHETGLNLGGWALSLLIALTLGSGLWTVGHLLARKSAKKSGRIIAMRRREAMALVGGGWFLCGIVAALPYLFCEPHVPFADAVFESLSGLTTTGSTIFNDLSQLPKSILVWRSVTQWVGGMGILAMFVVVLSGMTASSKTLIGAESSLANSDIASLRQTMRHLWGVYSAMTFICFLGLWAFGLTPFQAINYSLTALSTGGFGTENDSVGPLFSGGSKLWLTCFMFMGAISFPFYLMILKRRFTDLRHRFEEIWCYVILLVVASVLIISQSLAGNQEVGVIDVVFNVVSVSTTTGYVSSDYDTWSGVGVGVLILLMMIGGCSGSTAGGLKVSRIIFWFRFVSSGLERSFRPKVVSPIKLAGRQVDAEASDQLFLVLSLFGFFAITGTFTFQILDPGHSIMGAISAVISCLGNVGPAFAEMGPTENFSRVSSASKILFASLMVLGRLEYVALIVLFNRKLWRKY